MTSGPAVRQRPVGGESNEWYTPPEIFKALGLEFDLDVCAPPGGLPWIPAKRSLSYHDDGLVASWQGRVWLNPPYGPHVARWLARLADHGNGVALIFARTDVGWFQELAPRADLLCLVSGRIRFVPPSPRPGKKGHNAAAPSCLMAFGDENAAAVKDSGLGLCYELVASSSQATLLD